ncbi:class I SAM-dependent methyltransferase [Pseudomonas sp. sp1636]|uniref:class I SAM-dependent methyltransferase n=1 Tax=Pseudomonas sp. sp1636 TaxID=3036707 RepID=UPI0025A5748C|nr:class I SAM-dependent methyltransferase [Pseudomonas sp. sp1636]MDM8348850.1 class I SAM-dependent methyltransferase [Pseudomonas sp. sp1636]
MPTAYDDISLAYQVVHGELTVKKHAEEFTYLNLLGDVQGKTVLDLACGEGRFSRTIKRQGARQVVGVDISAGMIELARQAEKQRPLGISYIHSDVAALGTIGSFDMVSAAFLFNYAASKEALLALCRTAYNNLKAGGQLVASINATPLFPPRNDQATRKYGYLVHSPSPLHEGDAVEYAFFTGSHAIRLFNVHWSRATYEWALREAGFGACRWQSPTVSQQGLEQHGDEFWRDFLREPNFICLGACRT